MNNSLFWYWSSKSLYEVIRIYWKCIIIHWEEKQGFLVVELLNFLWSESDLFLQINTNQVFFLKDSWYHSHLLMCGLCQLFFLQDTTS